MKSVMASQQQRNCFHYFTHFLTKVFIHRENIPLISWGYALILAIPAAFVELSTPERELSPRTRIRIASAGSYHNLLTLGIVYLCSASGLHKTMWSILGYFDINRGVVIYGVKNVSLSLNLIYSYSLSQDRILHCRISSSLDK